MGRQEHRTSLGIIQPKAITGVSIEPKARREEQEWLAKERAILSQHRLSFADQVFRIDYIPYRFKVSWTCDDARCTGHCMGLLNWGLHQFYRRVRDRLDWREQVEEQMWRTLNPERNDVFLMLGNMLGKEVQFALMDTASVPKVEMPLFACLD